ncbi:hypothetical protein ACL6C3_24305 [Capilliphycus salinus ALCB114379]|uniref:hypothetical protein n=1 Tax=Capilliphycus salinus TaxID=2768948 RepID=UPI0039A62384
MLSFLTITLGNWRSPVSTYSLISAWVFSQTPIVSINSSGEIILDSGKPEKQPLKVSREIIIFFSDNSALLARVELGDVIASDNNFGKFAIACFNPFSNLNSLFSRVSLIPNFLDTLYITSPRDVIVSDNNFGKFAIACFNPFSNSSLVFSPTPIVSINSSGEIILDLDKREKQQLKVSREINIFIFVRTQKN